MSTTLFLTIGDSRVWCVGCKQWVPTEGFCEGDPDTCPVGEEDSSQRPPTLEEAQEAIDALAKELGELDDSTEVDPPKPAPTVRKYCKQCRRNTDHDQDGRCLRRYHPEKES